MDKYYIVENGQKAGPFSTEELKQKGLQRDALVWTEGLDNWTKAENIPMLKEVLQVTPPPIPNIEEPTRQQSNENIPPPIPSEPQGKYFGYELARRRERFFAALIEAIIIGAPLLLLFSESIVDSDPYSFGSIVGGAVFSAILGAIFYPMWGGNLGHKIMGLKVISAVDGKEQNKASAGALREALKSIFGIVFFPIVWLLWDDNRQNLYDKVVKTYVVKKKLTP